MGVPHGDAPQGLSVGVGAANAQKANQGEGAYFPGVHGSLQDVPLGLGGVRIPSIRCTAIVGMRQLILIYQI